MTASAGTSVSTRAKVNSTRSEDVWEIVVTFTIINGDTTGAATVPINGILQKVAAVIPNTSTDTQLSMTIKDNGDNTVFSAGPLAETATYLYSINEPLSGNIDIGLTFTNPGATGGDVVITLRGI